MALFALIRLDGVVGMTAEAAFAVAPPLEWIDISAANPTPEPGWTYSGGVFTAPAAPPAPSLAEQAFAASGAGLTIALSGTMTLAATLFPTDVVTQAKIGAVVTTLNTSGAFPGGATSYPLKDAAGTWHTLDIAQYKVVAGAIAAYVAACDLIADGNPLDLSALPSSSVSLTV